MANKPDLLVHNGRLGVWKDSGNKNAVEFEVSKTKYNYLETRHFFLIEDSICIILGDVQLQFLVQWNGGRALCGLYFYCRISG